ncbi:MAG TPA: ATP-dependent DNA helicase RecG [Bacteroidia bacterium]|nr:ATP-dependent DNA helicase RecG [Bacteroidia bacterium]
MTQRSGQEILDTPIEYLKGVGPARAEALKKETGIRRFEDLVRYYPFRYVDRTRFTRIGDLQEDQNYVQVRGVLEHIEILGQKRGKRLVARLRDESGTVDLVWFQGQQWIAQKLKTQTEYVVFGRVTTFMGRFNFAHPEIDQVNADFMKRHSAFEGVYSSTEKLKLMGLGSEGIRNLLRTLFLQLGQADLPESFDLSLRERYGLLAQKESLLRIHFPDNEAQIAQAERSLKFEELFYIQLRLLQTRQHRIQQVKGFVFHKVGEYFNHFFHQRLPYELTGAQKRVLKEIHQDLKSGKQMNRLLQGDVGSGKTLVALMSMLLALDNQYQACLMAPTEILAQQHFSTFSDLLKDSGLSFALLTGSSKPKQRKDILNKLVSGELQIIIGTHALIEDKVQFHNLGLVVIDEQHRFGVEQRARLQAKNLNPPHILIMTATPIPRTLAMTFYGDLDTSIIDEMPPGRKPVKTVHYTENKRLRLIGFLKEQIKLGRQIYIVYPLIQESEKMDYQNLQEGYDKLLHDFPPPNYQISIVHGKLSEEQKKAEMQRFIKGETQIMVATTVIEVGVNIPNASVMVIESAERFGLSQLHQLRGRVGRGADQSYCILMTGYKLGRESRQRLETMERTNDGFEISEVDLKLRGPGDIQGTMQSGAMDLKLANLAKDGEILNLARQAAAEILDKDADLVWPEHAIYAGHLATTERARAMWSRVG